MSFPPHIRGLNNFRNVGGLATSSTQSLRKDLLYRSANLQAVDHAGLTRLRDEYDIKVIFDLRDNNTDHLAERADSSHPIPVIHAPCIETFEDGYLQQYFNKLINDPSGACSDLYLLICTSAGEACRSIFNYIKDNPGCPILVNCELGKDRTGVVVAIILLVAWVSDEDIIRDFCLSEEHVEGLLPARREKLRQYLAQCEVSVDPVALSRHFSTLRDAMQLFLIRFRDIYGGGEGFLRSIGFCADDVDVIRSNMLV